MLSATALLCSSLMAFTACSGDQAAAVQSDPAASKKSMDEDVKEDQTQAKESAGEVKELALKKASHTNPVTGDTGSGEIVYGGDPSALVDGDKVYLYTGHDVSTDMEVKDSIYNIPEYLCYSTDNMQDFTYEGVVMTMDKVSWAANATSAWASQVEKYKDKYYLYYCSWEKNGKQSIGVAVSDSPTGPFEDIGEPLVRGNFTKPNTSSFNDIDPTVLVDTDEKGEEHRYLAWGNSILFICELNEDMISVKDINGDGEITCGAAETGNIENDIIKRTTGISEYTEAPWLYKGKDRYYLFFAHKWRECMAYATTDDLLTGEWKDQTLIMNPTSTSNTNHPAVIDFKGKTYFIGHNGALPAGSGFRRSATVQELTFNEDGSIDIMEESASGIMQETLSIKTPDGSLISHESYDNSLADSDYPYKEVKLGSGLGSGEKDSLFVLKKGKADKDNEYYVSIESENKPGLYFTVTEDDKIVLSQDTDASEETAKAQTFRSLSALDKSQGVSLESVSKPGFYITLDAGGLILSDGSEPEKTVFIIE
ncbi:MAG: family 43 glycosylhydrolase [Lachnospiraceae bacterium]|nr:family 43 glycosylhydrolase [Lachnospiraceae bacterium]